MERLDRSGFGVALLEEAKDGDTVVTARVELIRVGYLVEEHDFYSSTSMNRRKMKS